MLQVNITNLDNSLVIHGRIFNTFHQMHCNVFMQFPQHKGVFIKYTIIRMHLLTMIILTDRYMLMLDKLTIKDNIYN